MLRTSRTGPRLAIALVLALITTIGIGSPAFASGAWGDGDTGGIGLDDPGSGGGSSSGGSSVDDIADITYTPGPTTCTLDKGANDGADDEVKPGGEISCSRGDAYWDNAGQCYWQLSSAGAPATDGATTGAWYECVPYDCHGVCIATPVWMENPPAGITVLSPQQAASQLVKQLTISGIDIGMAPNVNADLGFRRSYVGIPIWMWAASQTQENWGPWEISATLGGQSISATATAVSVQWDMGDGNTVVCGAGSPYNTAYGNQFSPSCGHKYTATGSYNITATSNWEFNWSGGGQSGTIPLTATSTTQVEIWEAQSVNVPNP